MTIRPWYDNPACWPEKHRAEWEHDVFVAGDYCDKLAKEKAR